MKKIIVESKYDQKKLDTYLLTIFPGLTKNTLYKALRKKDILVNGKRITENITLFSQDEVMVYITDTFLYPKYTYRIIYEDEHILLLDKPAGISINKNESTEKSLNELVAEQYKNTGFVPMPCHRLDRNTTGLVLYAKTEEAFRILLGKFESQEIEKKYTCIVIGIFNKKKDTLHYYLFKDNKKSKVYISETKEKGYVPIITSYSVLKENKKKNLSLLEVSIKTGKTHQIRAQMAYLGHPVLGDGKYGLNTINKSFKVSNQLLYSYKIKFAFTSENGILDYLKDKTFAIDYPKLKEMME